MIYLNDAEVGTVFVFQNSDFWCFAFFYFGSLSSQKEQRHNALSFLPAVPISQLPSLALPNY